MADNRWHIAADWVEMFAPVIWDPLEAHLRERAVAERRRIDADLAAGRSLRSPIIWIADEVPIFGGTVMRFCVLVVAECEWLEGQAEPLLRLRVARAMPDRTMASWLLVWDELAGRGDLEVWPDFLVADNSHALLQSAKSRLGARFRWVPSVWHIAYNIRKAATGKSDNVRTPYPAIEAHLGLLSRTGPALSSVSAWSSWWDRLEGIFADLGLKASLKARRSVYEPAYAAVIPDRAGAWIAISNGGIEELSKSRIKPMFYRRTAFTSIERTNHLLDLAVARSHGALDSEAAVARRLREDAHAHGGWTVAARSIADPEDGNTGERYRSLRDPSLSVRQAYARGLA